jgi:hypothetical protein
MIPHLRLDTYDGQALTIRHSPIALILDAHDAEEEASDSGTTRSLKTYDFTVQTAVLRLHFTSYVPSGALVQSKSTISEDFLSVRKTLMIIMTRPVGRLLTLG